ncbi:MAG: DUF348 domain-containing protein [Anaerolineae bacterium]|nr:DUF348 domain-containing protein [Anaerolineae bacterium]
MIAKLKKFRLPGILLVGILLLCLGLFFVLRKSVTLSVNGDLQRITTYALRVGDLLRSEAIALSSQDKLTPTAETWLKNGQVITLTRAVPVRILADGKWTSTVSAESTPSRLFAEAGVTVYPGDLFLSNGRQVELDEQFPVSVQSIPLQLVRTIRYTLTEDGKNLGLTSTAPTLGSALWAAGYTLFEADQLTPAANSQLTSDLSAQLVHSSPLTIQTQYGEVSLRTSAKSVGQALKAANLSPQGLDYSLPTSTELIPGNRHIRLIRVTEEVLIEQTPLPFENEYQAVADMELDTQSVVDPGEYGLRAERVRVRYEDGQEVSRQTDSEWTAREPQARIIGYGTNVVMQTTTVDGVTIQYWRAVSMYATSYHPSEVGDTTASGLPLKKGVVAVDTSLIPFYTQLYIPGYGNAVAADIGGGVIGRWIDLGYSDSDYVPWHSWVTVYFLWPPPDNIVWILP